MLLGVAVKDADELGTVAHHRGDAMLSEALATEHGPSKTWGARCCADHPTGTGHAG